MFVDNAVLFTKIKNIYTKKAFFKEQNNSFHSYWIWIEKYLDVIMKVKNEVDSPSCQSGESRLLRLTESI